MSNERIDLTKDGLRKAIREHEGKYFEPTIEDVEIILTCLEGIGLLAELKRRYEEIDELKELCYEFMGQALTLYDVGNQHKDVDYDYQEFNKLRTRFAELLDFKSASE